MFEVGRLRAIESKRHHFHIRFRHSYKLNIALFPIFVNNMIVRLFNLIFFVLIFTSTGVRCITAPISHVTDKAAVLF